MAERRKYRPGQYELECFKALPERAQELWFDYCDKMISHRRFEELSFMYIEGMDYSDCQSPIEVIFKFAYDLVSFSEGYAGFFLNCQQKITSRNGKKHYYPDFVFIADEVADMVDIKNPLFKLIIECDGHEFHEKTKEQVQQDNEREYELKMLGFDVLRFSGSQIYNKPFRCAKQTLEYIKDRIGEKS